MSDERPSLSSVIEDQLAASFDGPGDDTGDEPAGAGDAEETAPEGDAPQRAESGPADDDDWFSLPEEAAPEPDHPFGETFKWEDLPDDPAVQKLAKGLHGSYSRKQMELAEERKRIEGERQELARYREYEARKRQDPAAAAQMLQQELAALGAAPPAVPQMPDGLQQVGQLLAAVDPENENEGTLKAVGQQLFQQLLSIQQQQQLFQQQQELEKRQREQEEAGRQVQADISDVEALVKRKLTDSEFKRIVEYAQQNGIPRFNLAFRLMYQDQFLKAAEQRGARRAEQTLSRKSLQSAMPPGAPPRTNSGEPRPPKDIRGNVYAALDEAGIS